MKPLKLKVVAATALCLGLVGGTLGTAFADTVTNDVTADVDDTFTAPGSTTVTYKINATGGDGQTGCNVSVGSPATLTLTVPASVTASSSSLVFSVCGVPGQKSVTFSSSTAGDYVIGASISGGVGSYQNNASFTLHVLAPVVSDLTPPSISYVLNPASPDGSNGWYKSNVSLTWTVTEAESTSSLVKTGCVDQNVTADQIETTYSCSATSDGGSAGPVDVKIKRDATSPAVSLVGGPTNGASYYFGSVPAAPTCDASDATSGLAGSCSVSGYGTTVGTHTVTASVSDNAGNPGSASATYTVLAWTLNGFYQPVDMNGVVNTVKGGSTVPLKFEVFAGATELTDTSIVSALAKLVTCNAVAGEDTVEVVATGGTSLRYDSVGGQFIYNWQTPKLPGKCYSVTMTTADGSSITALFKLK